MLPTLPQWHVRRTQMFFQVSAALTPGMTKIMTFSSSWNELSESSCNSMSTTFTIFSNEFQIPFSVRCQNFFYEIQTQISIVVLNGYFTFNPQIISYVYACVMCMIRKQLKMLNHVKESAQNQNAS